MGHKAAHKDCLFAQEECEYDLLASLAPRIVSFLL